MKGKPTKTRIKKLSTLLASCLMFFGTAQAQKHLTIFTQKTLPLNKETAVKVFDGDSFPFISYEYNYGSARHEGNIIFLTPREGDSSILLMRHKNQDVYAFVYRHSKKLCKPVVKLAGASTNGRNFIDIDYIPKLDRLVSICDHTGLDFGKIQSAQFIFAPKKGDAMVVGLKNDSIPKSARHIMAKAVPGDRIIFDRIRWKNEAGFNMTLLPLLFEFCQGFTYVEDSIASDDMMLIDENYMVQEYEVSEIDGKIIENTYMDYNKTMINSTLNGSMRFYVRFGSSYAHSATAIYKDGVLQEKTYFFTQRAHYKNAIKRTVKLVEGKYIESHYDEEGNLVAQGEVTMISGIPYLRTLNPTGFGADSPFDSLELESEFAPDGSWEIYDKAGILSVYGDLEYQGVQDRSRKDGEWTSGPKTITPKRKWKRLINPEF